MNLSELDLPGIQARLENWWAHGDQKHPCIKAIQPCSDESRIPDTQDLHRWWTDIDFIIERQMAMIDNQQYLGAALPYHYVNLGASAMAGVLGAQMDYVNRSTIWAHPKLTTINQVIDVKLDRKNSFYELVHEITRRSVSLDQDHHFVATFALGGAADTVAGLYGSESLLVDMIQDQQKVNRALARMTQIWIELFEEVDNIISSGGNYGRIGWTGVWAPESTFPIQEDFSYMISSEMFERFCLPQIRDMADAMDYPIYHLDGEGAVRHVDSLLKVDKLKAIQWEPGATSDNIKQWYGFIRHILSSKRSVQVCARAEEVEDLVKNVGARGLLIGIADPTTEEAARVFEKYAHE